MLEPTRFLTQGEDGRIVAHDLVTGVAAALTALDPSLRVLVRGASIPPRTFVVRAADGRAVPADPGDLAHRSRLIGFDDTGGASGTVARVLGAGAANATIAGTSGRTIWIGDGATGRLGAPVLIRPATQPGRAVWRQAVGYLGTGGRVVVALGLAYTLPPTDAAFTFAPGHALPQAMAGLKDALPRSPNGLAPGAPWLQGDEQDGYRLMFAGTGP